jgi:hypothetical protein
MHTRTRAHAHACTRMHTHARTHARMPESPQTCAHARTRLVLTHAWVLTLGYSRPQVLDRVGPAGRAAAAAADATRRHCRRRLQSRPCGCAAPSAVRHAGTGAHPGTSALGLGLTASTPAPRLGSPLPTSAPPLGSPLPTPAPRLGSPLPTSACGIRRLSRAGGRCSTAARALHGASRRAAASARRVLQSTAGARYGAQVRHRAHCAAAGPAHTSVALALRRAAVAAQGWCICRTSCRRSWTSRSRRRCGMRGRTLHAHARAHR